LGEQALRGEGKLLRLKISTTDKNRKEVQHKGWGYGDMGITKGHGTMEMMLRVFTLKGGDREAKGESRTGLVRGRRGDRS